MERTQTHAFATCGASTVSDPKLWRIYLMSQLLEAKAKAEANEAAKQACIARFNALKGK